MHRSKKARPERPAASAPTRSTATVTALPKRSIGALLADLSNPNPHTVVNPDQHGEDGNMGAGYNESEETDAIGEMRARERMELAAREHYVEVGVGNVRRNAQIGVGLDEGRYEGKKVSRKDVGFGIDESEDDDDEDDEDVKPRARIINRPNTFKRNGVVFEDMRDDDEVFDQDAEDDFEDDDDDDDADAMDDDEVDFEDREAEDEVDAEEEEVMRDEEDEDEEDDDGFDDEDDEEDEEEEDEDEGDFEEEDEYGVPIPKKSAGKAKKTKTAPSSKIETELAKLAQEETNLVRSMSQAAKADLEKGYHVRSQMVLWDNLLDTRMNLQKSLTLANTLPNFDSYLLFLGAPTSESLQSQVETTTKNIASLLQSLIRLRCTLVNRHPAIQQSVGNVSNTVSEKLGKRKRSVDDEDAELDESSSHDESIPEYLLDPLRVHKTLLKPLDDAFLPFRTSTLDKWSAKILASTSSTKFKAIQQGVTTQIANVLKDRERLLTRTRVLRSGGQRIGILPKPTTVDESGETEEKEGGEKKGKSKMDEELAKTDVEVFDDGDFYQMLLKELIESRMGDVDDPLLLSQKFAHLKLLQQKSKKKKQVDIRASKGRKLRYHVHEKIQNFMAPEPRGNWHEERLQELVSGLFGRVGAAEKPENEAEDRMDVGEGEVELPTDGLRVFG
ncbi:rRNA-processing protein bfr2 [Phlyctochytrium planicorne]|nr:rRNA-processing protein bfr2 [Phlyctochytrium planicorne]